MLVDDENSSHGAHGQLATSGEARLDTENCYAFRFRNGRVVEGQDFLSDPEHVENSGAYEVLKSNSTCARSAIVSAVRLTRRVSLHDPLPMTLDGQSSDARLTAPGIPWMRGELG